jgi:hypothetical protein
MPRFLVYREGSNAANQPRCLEAIPIAIVEARDAEEAARTTWGSEKPNVHGCPKLAAKVIASCGNLDVWSNQLVYAEAEGETDQEDWNLVLEIAARRGA